MLGGVAAPEVILDQRQVVALVGEVKSAPMAKQVSMKRTESGPPGSSANEVVDGLPGRRLPALRHEQPRQGVVACVQVALDCPQFVTGDGMFDSLPDLIVPIRIILKAGYLGIFPLTRADIHDICDQPNAPNPFDVAPPFHIQLTLQEDVGLYCEGDYVRIWARKDLRR